MKLDFRHSVLYYNMTAWF